MTLYALTSKHDQDGSENQLRWVKPVHTEAVELCTEHGSLLHSTTDGLPQCDYAFGMEFDEFNPCKFESWTLSRHKSE